MRRAIAPELLDDLAAGDPRAVRSRNDLRRLNRVMGHAGILTRALRDHLGKRTDPPRPLRLVELGAGDGTLLLRLARRLSARGLSAQVTLLDRQDLVSAETRRRFAALNWSVESAVTDVFACLESASSAADVMVTNLFLHHFSDPHLSRLLRLAAGATTLFIACEPRRSTLALRSSRLLWLLGCNRITRHDAVVSVQAGFLGRELSALWPAEDGWHVEEHDAGAFSHRFIARRDA